MRRWKVSAEVSHTRVGDFNERATHDTPEASDAALKVSEVSHTRVGDFNKTATHDLLEASDAALKVSDVSHTRVGDFNERATHNTPEASDAALKVTEISHTRVGDFNKTATHDLNKGESFDIPKDIVLIPMNRMILDSVVCPFPVVSVDNVQYFCVPESVIVNAGPLQFESLPNLLGDISAEPNDCELDWEASNIVREIVQENEAVSDRRDMAATDTMVNFDRFLKTDLADKEDFDQESLIIPDQRKSKKKKPARPCVFCDSKFVRLQEHMKHSHCNEQVVMEACLLPKKQRNAVFQKLRYEGMKNFNTSEMKKEKPEFQRCRSAHRKDSENLVMCDKCEAFIFHVEHFL